MINLHPQTQLSTRRTSGDPVFASVEYSYRWNGTDSFSPKLGQLVSRPAVNIDESVHITDTESLDVRLGIELPLWP